MIMKIMPHEMRNGEGGGVWLCAMDADDVLHGVAWSCMMIMLLLAL